MKKWISFLAVCLLLLPAARADAGAAAILEQGVGIVPGSANFNSEAVIGDTVCSLDYNNSSIYQYCLSGGTTQMVSARIPLESGDDEKRARVPFVIVGDGKSVYAIEATLSYGESDVRIEDLGFYRLSIGETVSDELLCALDFGDEIMSLETGEFIEAIESVAYGSSMLFVAFDASEPAAVAVDTSTGETAALNLPGIFEFAVLDETHVLAACHPDSAAETELYFVNPATLEAARKSAIPDDGEMAHGFAYYEKALYFMRNGAIWKLTSLDGESATVVANSPVSAWRATVSESGMYVTGNILRITPRDLARAEKPITLTYGGEIFPASAADEYTAARPGVTLEGVQYESRAEMVSAILTRSPQPDIYFFHTVSSPLFLSMRDRGYCVPIESDIVTNAVAEMYQGVGEFVTHEGALTAAPFGIVPQFSMGIDREIWRAMGLREEDIPATWIELLAFLRDEWPGLAAQYPAYAIEIDEDRGRETIFYLIMNQYNNRRLSLDADPGYDVTEFRSVMETFLSIDFESLPNDNTLPQGRYLFNVMYMISPEISRESFSFMPLTFSREEKPVASMALLLAAINPNSTHREEALDFIEYLMAHMNPLERAALCPGYNEPVESPDYVGAINDFNAALKRYEEAIAAEKDEVRAEELRLEMEEYRERNAELYEGSRWKATAESIAVYRASVEDIIPSCAYTVNEADQEAQSKLFEQFLAGDVGLDQFISELDRMFHMNRLEDQ